MQKKKKQKKHAYIYKVVFPAQELLASQTFSRRELKDEIEHERREQNEMTALMAIYETKSCAVFARFRPLLEFICGTLERVVMSRVQVVRSHWVRLKEMRRAIKREIKRKFIFDKFDSTLRRRKKTVDWIKLKQTACFERILDLD